MTQSELFSNSLCTDQVHVAERELAAFIAAVAELFGVEQACLSAEDWLGVLELMDSPPKSTWQDWRWVRDLNSFYRGQPSMHESDATAAGFEWVDCKDYQRSVLSFIRRAHNHGDITLVACNFTPVPRQNYRIGVPWGGFWKEILNSDARTYGGSGQGNLGGLQAAPLPIHGRSFSLNLTLPPLGVVFFRHEAARAA